MTGGSKFDSVRTIWAGTCAKLYTVDVKFLLLHAPAQATTTSRIPAAPTSPQTEEAIRQFFVEVYESWVKTIMSPFYHVNMEVKSPIFRGKVVAAAKKYLWKMGRCDRWLWAGKEMLQAMKFLQIAPRQFRSLLVIDTKDGDFIAWVPNSKGLAVKLRQWW